MFTLRTTTSRNAVVHIANRDLTGSRCTGHAPAVFPTGAVALYALAGKPEQRNTRNAPTCSWCLKAHAAEVAKAYQDALLTDAIGDYIAGQRDLLQYIEAAVISRVLAPAQTAYLRALDGDTSAASTVSDVRALNKLTASDLFQQPVSRGSLRNVRPLTGKGELVRMALTEGIDAVLAHGRAALATQSNA